jgi:hypothetical protein
MVSDLFCNTVDCPHNFKNECNKRGVSKAKYCKDYTGLNIEE